MKIKITLLYIFSVLTFVATGQDIENDDMYFNAKDREKLQMLQANNKETTPYASARKTSKREAEEEETLNPTDSYSARNVNPEFEARSNAESARDDNEDYFVNDYRYNTTSDFNNFNNNFNRWYNNPWYTSSWFGPSINSWNTPYYGYYDPFYSPWYDPYWNYNGWSASFSYHWGSSWNYGWGGNYNYWNRPYGGWGWGSSFGPSWGWGSRWYGYPGSVIIVNNGEGGGRGVAYGKRATRGTTMANPARDNSSRTRTTSTVTSGGGRSNESTTGRTRANGRQEEYYNRSWKYTAPANSNTNTTNTRTRSSNNNNDSWGYQNNNSWNNQNRQSSPSYNQGRSSSLSYNSGATRQHSSGSSSGSNGRTRGRD